MSEPASDLSARAKTMLEDLARSQHDVRNVRTQAGRGAVA